MYEIYKPFWALFQGFEPLFGSYEPDLDPHQRETQDSEVTGRIRILHQGDADPKDWYGVLRHGGFL